MRSELDEDLRLCQAINLKHLARNEFRRVLGKKSTKPSNLLDALDLMNLSSREVERLKGRTTKPKDSTLPTSQDSSGNYIVRETQTEEQRQVNYPISWGEVATDCYAKRAREDLATAHSRASRQIRAGGDTWPSEGYANLNKKR